MKEEPKSIVLVIEENNNVNAYLSAILELMDLEAISISSPDDCLGRLNELHISSKSIEAAIISGDQAIRRGGMLISQLKQFNKQVKILAVVRDKGDRHMLLSAGADSVVTKPVSGQTISVKVLKLIKDYLVYV
jgi:DNA-binding response OmpR family regulator